MNIAGGDEENISLYAINFTLTVPFDIMSKFFVLEVYLVIGQMSFHDVMLQN